MPAGEAGANEKFQQGNVRFEKARNQGNSHENEFLFLFLKKKKTPQVNRQTAVSHVCTFWSGNY